MLARNIGPRDDYYTVELRLLPAADSDTDRDPVVVYPAELQVVGWRIFSNLQVKLDLPALQALSLDPVAYGRALGAAIFADDGVGSAYTEVMAALRGRGDGLQVRLQIEPPQLHALHWERIYHPIDGQWQPLGSTGVTPLSRFVQAKQWDRPLPVTERPIRLLAVIATPEGLDSYNLDAITTAEISALHAELDKYDDLLITYLETGTSSPPTLTEIRRALADGHHFIHFLCHGANTDDGAILYLEDDAGAVDPVTRERMVGALKSLANPPIFCFLAACESAARSRQDGFTPLAPALVQDGGVHAVVAMSDKVAIATAQQFTRQFYARLLTHGMVDLAVNEARALIQDEWDWGVPVLFSRLPDNQLVDFPIGHIYTEYLAHSEHAYRMADEALANARMRDQGQQLVNDLERLIKELSKSYEVLVNVASDFRRTGITPDTFPARFEAFYYDFKDIYDGQTWVDEDTSCREITVLSIRILPELQPLLDAGTFQQLDQELTLLGNEDANLMRLMRGYLDTMNGWVEEIWALLAAGEIDEALERKRAYAVQISPSLRRSKETFERMSNSITAVAAA